MIVNNLKHEDLICSFLNFFSCPLLLVADTCASPNLKLKHKKQNNNLFAMIFLPWEGCNFFEIGSVIQAFVKDNGH